MSKQELLQELYSLYKEFQKSSLYIPGATTIVFGEGNPESPIVFIGEAPGAEEDKQGRPFVGRSGKLLTRALEVAETPRSSVFITNIVKCRPPENRTPTAQEIATGKRLLLQHELAIIQPRVIVPLGLSALKGLLEKPCTMAHYRGNIHTYQNALLMPTYHPAYVLRNQSTLSVFLGDIQAALHAAGSVS